MKTAIILSGGGIEAAYDVGALFELKERGIIPDIIIAASASSGTAAYYVAKQYTGIRIWEELLSDKHFINFWRMKKIVDIDYVIDDIFKKQEPLSESLVKESNITFLISATDVENGEVCYFSNRDNDYNVFESMRASMALPLVYRKTVSINSREYSDGLFSGSPYLHIKKAKELGADNIIVVDCIKKRPTVPIFLYKLYLLFKSKKFRETSLNYLRMKNDTENVIIIKNQSKIGSVLDNKKEFIKRLIAEGRKLEGFKLS